MGILTFFAHLKEYRSCLERYTSFYRRGKRFARKEDFIVISFLRLLPQ